MGQLSVLVNNREIKQYNHQGQVYVEGREDQAYIIRYKNTTNRRQKIVVSVDGLNVKTGDSTWDSAYVVDPYGIIDVPGWRKDENNTAAFRFSSVKNSYNNLSDNGNINNVGVIGCKVYNEKIVVPLISNNAGNTYYHHYHHYNDYYGYRPWPYYSWPNYTYWNGPLYVGGGGIGLSGGGMSSCSSINMASQNAVQTSFTLAGGPGVSGAGAATPTMDCFVAQPSVDPLPQNSIGTGWGENVEFKTQPVYAAWEETCTEVHVLYYDERRGLEKRGIVISTREDQRVKPNPFPGSGCTPPSKDYKGRII